MSAMWVHLLPLISQMTSFLLWGVPMQNSWPHKEMVLINAMNKLLPLLLPGLCCYHLWQYTSNDPRSPESTLLALAWLPSSPFLLLWSLQVFFDALQVVSIALSHTQTDKHITIPVVYTLMRRSIRLAPSDASRDCASQEAGTYYK